MLKVSVLEIPGRSADVAQLLAALKQLTCAAEIKASLVSPTAFQASSPDFLLMLLTAELDAMPVLDGLLVQAVNTGCRVVGVWPMQKPGTKAKNSLEKYGFAICPWDMDKLSRIICGGNVILEDPAGTPRDEPITPRNKC